MKDIFYYLLLLFFFSSCSYEYVAESSQKNVHYKEGCQYIYSQQNGSSVIVFAPEFLYDTKYRVYLSVLNKGPEIINFMPSNITSTGILKNSDLFNFRIWTAADYKNNSSSLTNVAGTRHNNIFIENTGHTNSISISGSDTIRTVGYNKFNDVAIKSMHERHLQKERINNSMNKSGMNQLISANTLLSGEVVDGACLIQGASKSDTIWMTIDVGGEIHNFKFHKVKKAIPEGSDDDLYR